MTSLNTPPHAEALAAFACQAVDVWGAECPTPDGESARLARFPDFTIVDIPAGASPRRLGIYAAGKPDFDGDNIEIMRCDPTNLLIAFEWLDAPGPHRFIVGRPAEEWWTTVYGI